MAVMFIPNDIKGLEFKEQASFAAGDPTGSYTALKAYDINFKPGKSIHIPPYQKPQGCRNPDAGIPGAESGVLTFKTLMRGGDGAESEFSLLASNIGLDRNSRANDSAVVVSGTVDNVVSLIADGGVYEVGDGIMVGSSATDAQIRFVSGESDNGTNTTLITEPSWTAILSASDNFYALDTFAPAEANLGEPAAYMAFKVFEGGTTAAKHLYTLTGCACSSCKIVVPGPNQLAYAEWEYQVDDWLSAETAGTVTADAFSPAEPALGNPCYIDNTEVYIRAITFDLGLKLMPYEATSGTHGRKGWIYTGIDPKIEAEFYWNQAYLDAWIAGTTYQFLFEAIKSGTTDEGWALYIPKIQIIDANPDTAGDLKGMKPTFQILDPGYNGDTVPLLIPLFGIAVTGSGT